MKTAILVALSIAVAACGTVYQKKNVMTQLGYSDMKIGKGRYRVKYEAAAASGEAKAVEFWHQRATELCGSTAYTHYHKVTFRESSELNRYSGRFQSYRHPIVQGNVVCQFGPKT